MAHFAKIDSANVVTAVHRLSNDVLMVDGVESEQRGVDFLAQLHGGGTWIQTSYNTRGGKHSKGGTPMRKNYAGRGYKWRSDLDAFVSPRPFESWSLNRETCRWDAPVPRPEDGMHWWDEGNLKWVGHENGED